MAKEGKKLELYEILAAKRAKGKTPLFIEARQQQEAQPEPEPPAPIPAPAPEPRTSAPRTEATTDADEPEKLVIIDDALDMGAANAEFANYPPPRQDYAQSARTAPRQAKASPYRATPPQPVSQGIAGGTAAPAAPQPAPVPAAEPRVRKPREVVLALDTAFIMFVVIVALVGSSYFLGYKRGQEERPAGMAGMGDIETANPENFNLRHLSPAARSVTIPPEQDYTLVLRTEPATEELPERLEYELAEAMARGSREYGAQVQGFIFLNRTGNDSRFVLAVGLARTPNDADLNRLLQIYNRMEGISLSREPRPYIGCQIAPIRELGRLVE